MYRFLVTDVENDSLVNVDIYLNQRGLKIISLCT
jgi:hypothetical protein